MTILNLTQHDATKDQIENGVVELPESIREILTEYLTFDEMPNFDFDNPDNFVNFRARAIAMLAANYFKGMPGKAMIGGAPFLMPILAKELRKQNIEPLLAFTKRETSERILPDGTIQKVALFKHIGFIPHP